MGKHVVDQAVNGRGNQTAGVVGSQQQTNNHLRMGLEIHIAAPARAPLFSISTLRIHISVDAAVAES